MAYEIIVKKRFTKKISALLLYLEKNWNKSVADNFLSKLDQRISRLASQPFTGSYSEKNYNVRSVLITKHNRLYYRVKNNCVEIINLYDTRTNPAKNSYIKK